MCGSKSRWKVPKKSGIQCRLVSEVLGMRGPIPKKLSLVRRRYWNQMSAWFFSLKTVGKVCFAFKESVKLCAGDGGESEFHARNTIG